MKNLFKIGRSLNKNELKEISGGHLVDFIDDGSDHCKVGQCPGGLVCEITRGKCLVPGGGDYPGGGGICPENVGMNCDSPY